MGLKCVCVASLLLLSAAVIASAPGETAEAEVDPIEKLAGRWAGEGTMVPAYGRNEQFNCVITYAVGDDASRVRQHLRCHSRKTRFDAVTSLEIEDDRVTGVWADNVYSLNGTVRGTVTDKGFDIRLSSSFFQAKMTVATTGCEQSVRVVPEGGVSMKEIAAVLKKSNAARECQPPAPKPVTATAAVRPPVTASAAPGVIIPPVPAVRPAHLARP